MTRPENLVLWGGRVAWCREDPDDRRRFTVCVSRANLPALDALTLSVWLGRAGLWVQEGQADG